MDTRAQSGTPVAPAVVTSLADAPIEVPEMSLALTGLCHDCGFPLSGHCVECGQCPGEPHLRSFHVEAD